MDINFPELLDNHFLIALSGGLDSMVLTELCQHLGLEFSLAHCNFGLRGTKSDGDEQFVREYAKKIKKSIYVTHFDTIGYVNQHKVSIQMAARELRYQWFAQIQSKHNIPFLVTAHHSNDNLETFLINLSRGTGIEGLTGIPDKKNSIRRPLLPFARLELEDFAHKHRLGWRDDSSNRDTKYLRNKIRLEVIPILMELHPTFLDNFKNTQHFLGQTEKITSSYLHRLREELFIDDFGKYRISIPALKNLEPLDSFLYGLFKDFGFKNYKNLRDLLDAMSGKQLISKTHILVKDRNDLLLSSLNEDKDALQVYFIDEELEGIELPIPLKFSVVNERSDNTECEIYIQKNALKYPLKLRKWKKGDYFCPLGLKGKKKLSKFFKDEKVDVLSKNDIWLLCSDDEIVWVIGMRADHRFRVTANTQEILKIEVK